MITSMLFPQRFTQLAKEHGDIVAALFCGLLLLLGWLALNFGWLGLALFLLPAAYVIGGYESAREGLTTLFQEKELDVDLLMIVAALGAAILGLWKREYNLIIDGAILILIFATSGALEGYAMRRTERSIQSLMNLTPDTARILFAGSEKIVPVGELEVGDEIIVKPGELIPADGLIISGYSTINQAAITGESIPIEKTVGEEVFAGTLNGYGALKLQVHKPPVSNLIQRIIHLVEQAQTEAPPNQQFIEKFERGYAKVIVISGILLAILPPYILGWDWEVTIYRALTFLVVASPCALMAAIMPTLLSAIANSAKQGILCKNGAQLEIMGKVRAIAFDKTGTLTTGKLQVSHVVAQDGFTENDVLRLAAAVESNSEHPIGKAIVQAADGLEWSRAIDVQAIPGLGIFGIVGEQKLVVGNAAFIQQYVPTLPEKFPEIAESYQKEGKTVVWVAQSQTKSATAPMTIVGIMAIADKVRETAPLAIERLRKLGIEEIVILTGDNAQTAQTVAQAVGIEQVHAELLPEDKLDVIRHLQKRYETVAMVGDGINDAPALAQASIGIAMGGDGSDVALETADIVLMADKLEKIALGITLGRRSQQVIQQNIAIALASILLLLIGNFLGAINLPIGVIGHEGSTILVTLNGLRLLKS